MADSNRVKEQLKEITEKLEKGIQEVFESDKYKEYLNTMSKFYNYSFNNTMLIAMQKPDATLVAGYHAWQKKFERHVKQGEKGIRIIAPAPIIQKEELEKLDPVTQEPMLDERGKPFKEEVEIRVPTFKVISVFDVSQTDGKELLGLAVDELDGSVENYELFMQALTEIAPVPIGYEQISNGAKGYYHLEEKRIALQEGMSEVQNTKTAIHEIAHAMLHDIDLNNPMQGEQKDKKTKEVEAESIAYAVSQHYGIDTSDYSFGYVAGWSSDKELKELKSSLETIRKTSATLINAVDERIADLEQQRNEITLILTDEEEKLLSGKENCFGIYQLKKGEELHYHRFEGLESLQTHGLSVEKENYDLIHTASLQERQTLDDIFEQFNLFHPEDFTGHSLSVSDIVVLHKEGVNTAHYVDHIGFREIPEFLEKAPELSDQKSEVSELAFQIADRYLSIQVVDDGYDYSIFDESYRLLDGGIYDNPDLPMMKVVDELVEELKEPIYDAATNTYHRNTVQGAVKEGDALIPIDYEELMEKTEEANRIEPAIEQRDKSLNQIPRSEIEETVLAFAQTKAEEYGYEVEILDAKVYGSRAGGLEHPDSDLDVVLEYKGDIREDDFFTMLNEDGLSIGGMMLDINPITADKSGTIKEYLARANEYLEEKIKSAREITSDKEKVEVITEEPTNILTFYVAECMEFTDLGEYHENLTLEEAMRLYESIPAGRMNGIKGIGFTLHKAEDEIYKDSTMAILDGRTIDVDTINRINEFRNNSFIQDAIKEVIQRFPDAEVWDRETKERECQEAMAELQQDYMSLSVEIDQFCEVYDTYEYRNAVESKENNIEDIYGSLYAGETDSVKEWLQSVIDEEEPAEDVIRAKEILRKVEDLVERREKNPLTKAEELEEANYNQIDGILNNQESEKEGRGKTALSIMERLNRNREKIADENQKGKLEMKESKNPERGME